MNRLLRVLIVEDSENDALLLLREVRRGGYEPEYLRVDTAEEMSAALEKQHWDVVLSDYVLPGFSGLQALELLHEKGIDIPFIIVSGQIGEDVAVEAMRAGAHDYVMKGNLKRLAPAIGRELAEAEIRRERKWAEEALRHSEERYRRLAENASDVIWTMDMTLRFTYVSPSITRLSGYSVEEAMAKSFNETMTPESLKLTMEIYERELQFELSSNEMTPRPVTLELEQYCKDGSTIFTQSQMTFLRDTDGKPVGILGVTRDITERKRMEDSLRRSEASLAEAQRIAHLGNWDWDIVGNGLWWSDEVYRIFGLMPAQFSATYDAFLGCIHPEDRERVQLAVTAALREGAKYSIEHRVIRPDGTQRVVHEQGEVTFDDEGKPIRMIGTVLDITERKQFEDRLQALSRRLIAIQEEERRNIGRELHDQIGQSLTVLKLLVDNAIKSSAGQMVGILEEADMVAYEVITQLRDLSLELRPIMLDDLGLLPTLIWYTERLSARTGVRIDLKHSGLARQFPQEIATAAYRIIQEALTNVIRYAKVEEAIVRAWVDQNKLIISIEDHGCGFDPGELEFKNSAGLSGMEERALLLDGTLTIETSPGNGTCITAELPLSDQ